MIREEAIEILSDMRAEYNLFGDEEEATRYHVLSWAIQAMKYTKRWIPTSERLPENTRTVLTTFIEDGVAKVDTLNYFGKPLEWTDFRYVEELGRPKSYEVTAWMPLPDPWKGEEE